MACKYVKNNGNVIGALAPNGKESTLFKKLAKSTGSITKAKAAYDILRSNKFKKWFGKDWESSTKDDSALDLFYLDENGEPLMIAARGEFVVMNSKMETQTVEGATNTINSSGLSLLQETNLTRIAVQVFKNNKNNKDFNVNSFFNPITPGEDKGQLAEKILIEAFEGLNNSNAYLAKELFNVYKTSGFKNMLNAMPEGITFNPAKRVGQSFLMMYDQWEDVVSPYTGNIDRPGWRSRIKVKLEDSSYSLRDDSGEVLDIDDTPVRIHNISRLQEDPKSKLSSEARGILGNIPSEIGVYGYAVDMEMADVYSAVAEATVGQMTYTGMIQQFQNLVKYKPNLAPILNRLKSATAKEQASLFSNFANSYKNFLLVKAKKIISFDYKQNKIDSFVQTSMISSNQSDTGKKAMQDWANTSKEYDTPPSELRLLDVPEDWRKLNPFNEAEGATPRPPFPFQPVEAIRPATLVP